MQQQKEETTLYSEPPQTKKDLPHIHVEDDERPPVTVKMEDDEEAQDEEVPPGATGSNSNSPLREPEVAATDDHQDTPIEHSDGRGQQTAGSQRDDHEPCNGTDIDEQMATRSSKRLRSAPRKLVDFVVNDWE